MKIIAFHIGEAIHLARLRENYSGEIVQSNPSELFYRVDDDQFAVFFDYGAVASANMSDVDITKNLLLLEQFCENPLAEKPREDIEIIHKPQAGLEMHFDNLQVPELNEKVVEIAMLNLAHSVALDFFSQRGQALLGEIRELTGQLAREGRMHISRKNMLRFIGRTLNNKNRIVENLFIFDTPDLVWDDEYLNQVHRALARNLEIQTRFREVEYTFKVVEDNLSVYREVYMHRESSQLEWIIIALICIEVIDLIANKVDKWF
ncbi:MAG: RMD1 family protein [Saprospiraceae bacterium]|nr:RMD1 family protein [Saprospiraceae bacterium]